MNKIKHLLSALILSVLVIPAVTAQDAVQNNDVQSTEVGPRVKKPQMTTEQKAKALTDTLNSVLGLTPDQYSKAYTSNLKYATQKETLKSQGRTDMEAVKTQMKQISDSRKTEIATILTPEQSQVWKIWKQAHKEEFKQKHPESSDKIQFDPYF